MPADALLSPLEEELQRARELESAGKDRVDAQEKRIAHLKDAEATAPQSVRLLDIMRETQKLQGGHVLLLEREVREWFAQKKPSQKRAPSAPDDADQYRQRANECEDAALLVRDAELAITYRDLAFQWRDLATKSERIERDKLKARW